MIGIEEKKKLDEEMKNLRSMRPICVMCLEATTDELAQLTSLQ